jgi:hypothetical protein
MKSPLALSDEKGANGVSDTIPPDTSTSRTSHDKSGLSWLYLVVALTLGLGAGVGIGYAIFSGSSDSSSSRTSTSGSSNLGDVAPFPACNTGPMHHSHLIVPLAATEEDCVLESSRFLLSHGATLFCPHTWDIKLLASMTKTPLDKLSAAVISVP